mmetsp:Transcript_13071/g.52676  ORF Transcript_13071/g.52676 Transcript_13071/m.52676 type:complete len:265 (-) Transcript_13071:10-804(-)
MRRARSSMISYRESTKPSRRHPSPAALRRSNLRFSFAGHRARLSSSAASLASTVSVPRSRSSKSQRETRSSRSRAATHRRNCALSSPPQPQNPLGYPFVAMNPRSSYTVTPPKQPSASYLHPPASSTLTKPPRRRRRSFRSRGLSSSSFCPFRPYASSSPSCPDGKAAGAVKTTSPDRTPGRANCFALLHRSPRVPREVPPPPVRPEFERVVESSTLSLDPSSTMGNDGATSASSHSSACLAARSNTSSLALSTASSSAKPPPP